MQLTTLLSLPWFFSVIFAKSTLTFRVKIRISTMDRFIAMVILLLVLVVRRVAANGAFQRRGIHALLYTTILCIPWMILDLTTYHPFLFFSPLQLQYLTLLLFLFIWLVNGFDDTGIIFLCTYNNILCDIAYLQFLSICRLRRSWLSTCARIWKSFLDHFCRVVVNSTCLLPRFTSQIWIEVSQFGFFVGLHCRLCSTHVEQIHA